MANTILAKNVKKHFGSTKALRGISLEVPEGSIFGLLGPNGAGKTTLIRIMSTLLQPDAGQVEVGGFDVVRQPEKVREVIGLAGQYAAVDEFLTGYENIYYTGRLYGLRHKESKRRAKDLLERLDLAEAANRTVKTYSGGMRRRLDLGASLIGQPRIFFLDEPTTGLDPRTRIGLWDTIRSLRDEGATILLTTQYLEEADELADEIAVINDGRTIASGTSDQLKAKLGGDVVEVEIDPADQQRAMTAINRLARRRPKIEDEGRKIIVPVASGAKSLLSVVQALNVAKVQLISVSLHRPTLDDVFLALTGDKAVAEPSKRKVRRVN